MPEKIWVVSQLYDDIRLTPSTYKLLLTTETPFFGEEEAEGVIINTENDLNKLLNLKQGLQQKFDYKLYLLVPYLFVKGGNVPDDDFFILKSSGVYKPVGGTLESVLDGAFYELKELPKELKKYLIKESQGRVEFRKNNVILLR